MNFSRENPPVRRDFTKPQGDAIPIPLTVEADEDGAAMTDAEGWSLLCTVKSALADEDDDALAVFTGSPTEGSAVLRVVLDTRPLPADARLVYDVKALSPSGRTYTVQHGNLFTTQPVNRTLAEAASGADLTAFFRFEDEAGLLALPTASSSAGRIVVGTLGFGPVFMRLVVGSQETGGGYYRPADYAGLVWEQMS